MNDSKSFLQVAGQLREFAKTLTPRQRMLIGAGAALVVIVLATFVKMLSHPEMTVLYSNMEPADARAMGEHLSLKSIHFQMSPDGKAVLVPADQLDAARLEIAATGTPHSGRLGFELFDKTNWAASDFDDKVNYQRALEGELERTIQAMNGVAGARVHLALPPDSIYSGQERQAKAGVILTLKDTRLTPAMRQSVQRLVASAVDKLDAQSVTVVDSNAGESEAPSAESASSHNEEDLLAARLVHTLVPIVGEDHVRATVHAEFDPSTVEEQEESYDPDQTVTLSMQRSEETSAASQQPSGAAGTPSNVPGGGTPARASAQDGGVQSKSENGTYAASKIIRHTMQPAGRLKRLAVAVLIDDAYNPANKNTPRQKRTPEELKGIEDLAKASIGFDAARGDIVSVQNISFQTVPSTTSAPQTKVQKIQSITKEWSNLIRVSGLLVLFLLTYFMVLRPVKKQMIRAMNPGTAAHAPLPENLSEAAGTALPEGSPQLEMAASPAEESSLVRLKGDISLRIRQEPVSASRLVQSWLRESKQT